MPLLLSLAPTPHSRFPRGAIVEITSDEDDHVHVVYPGETEPTCTTLTGFVRLPAGVAASDPRVVRLGAAVAELGDFDIGEQHVTRMVEIAFGIES